MSDSHVGKIFEITVIHDRELNYALQQNDIPVIKSIQILNNSSEEFVDLTLRLSSSPSFAIPLDIQISSIPAGRTIELNPVNLMLNPEFLAGQNERQSGLLSIALQKSGQTVVENTHPVSLLAHDEWGGSTVVPEVISAFITPNHPYVTRLIRRAAEILNDWTSNPSLDGYQSKSRDRVRVTLAAIYAAIQECNIVYCVPPPSFESSGQKIRTPDNVLENKLGTCLDLTLLFAACAEAAGINSLVIFVKGHAFVGFWLINESFADSVQDDVTLLSKRVASGVQEICVVETTSVTAGKNCPFERSIDAASSRLRSPDEFLYFIDIARSRFSGIRPLPTRVHGITIPQDSAAISQKPTPHEAPSKAGLPYEVSNTPKEKNELPRLEQWERRLLDLSLRNSLLNFRTGSAGIPILTTQLEQLENELADGRDFEIHPIPQDWSTSPRDSKAFQHRTHTEAERHLLDQEFKAHRLRADLTADELGGRLTQLYRAARTSLEENGANTLFLAVGMLLWTSPNHLRPLYAPLLLLPMELVRKSVKSGYVIRQGDDDPVFNITLLEMLRQEYGIDIPSLSELPKDDHGIDVNAVMTIVRRAVMNKTGWDVIDTASLGLFSFNKFVMWNDLKARTDDLKRNLVVRSLITSTVPPHEDLDEAPVNLDDTCGPADLLCPVSADSSQLLAIRTAASGQNMVLHGPPGTGKSQTITNIIADALGRGKSVLFVAEKIAALNVVKHRLEKIGLGPFCLELHSNKSRKKDVIDQIGASIRAATDSAPADWATEAGRLKKLRLELNTYVEALHRDRQIGHSIFTGLARLAATRQASGAIVFKPEATRSLKPDTLQLWFELTHQLSVAASPCGNLAQHPWKGTRRADYSPQTRSQILEAINKLRTNISEITEHLSHQDFVPSYLSGTPGLTRITEAASLSALLLSAKEVPKELLTVKDWNQTKKFLEQLAEKGSRRDALSALVFQRFQTDIVEIDARFLLQELQKINQKWAIPRWIGRSKIRKVLASHASTEHVVKSANLESEIEEIRALQELNAWFDGDSAKASSLLGCLWGNGFPDWIKVVGATEKVDAIVKQAFSMGEACGLDGLEILAGAADLLDLLASNDSGRILKRNLSHFISATKNLQSAWTALSEIVALEQTEMARIADCEDFPSSINIRLDGWASGIEHLRNWCAWNRTRSEAIQGGLKPVVDACEDGRVPTADLESAFQRGLYEIWVEDEIVRDPILSTFSRSLHEDRIQQFRTLEDSFAILTRQELYARLAKRIPRPQGNASQNSEFGILGRELQKQRAHMALRTLFQKIPNILPRLKPCMLMSPMSVAQYLDPAHSQFDVVIFDEASQVPTCEAVGAIARGKQVIVVGDPKQLPPTTFFARGDTDEDEDSLAIKDLDSILDDCLAIRMNENHLLWHYRSRHESLIAFSNSRYYDNNLLTFPSPDDLTPKVGLVSLKGLYDRGKTRQNRIEGNAVVSEIVRRLKDPVLSKFSIGVVTFNQPQQKLIEDLLDEQIRQHPELESFVSAGIGELAEKIFVKNLENVQGDERDVIIFSIGYGPDSTGHVSMNFGPLNSDGGWRRLNVAVSRARHEMIIFSSLRPEQVDTSRSKSRGVADLKAFLEFAQRGVVPMMATISESERTDRLFERVLCAQLQQRDLQVKTQVGASGYKIDLAIVDPANPGRYLLGIICDGPSYKMAKTARDRDKLCEGFLVDLGWRLHRVWSTDWWENPSGEIDRIMEEVEKAITAKLEAPEKAIDPAITTEPTPPKKPVEEPRFANTWQMEPSEQSPKSHQVYNVCSLPTVYKDQYDFYQPCAVGDLRCQIFQVIMEEGPISHPLLARRVANAWGMRKVGSRIDERIRSVSRTLDIQRTEVCARTWYWPPVINPHDYQDFRIPGDLDDSKRDAEDIPPEEFANAAYEIIRNSISLPRQDLVRETARLLGFQRVGGTVEECTNRGIAIMLGRGCAKMDNESRVVLIDKQLSR